MSSYIDWNYLNIVIKAFDLTKVPDDRDVQFWREAEDVQRRLVAISILVGDIDLVMQKWQARKVKYDKLRDK